MSEETELMALVSDAIDNANPEAVAWTLDCDLNCPALAAVALGAVPDGWIKFNGQWLRMQKP